MNLNGKDENQKLLIDPDFSGEAFNLHGNGEAGHASTEPLRFTRLKLENWRNFRKVDVALPGRVFLLGPNAAGKSNFLDAFRFLRDVADSRLDHAVTMNLRGGIPEIRSMHAKGPNSSVAIEVSIGTDEKPRLWQYRLAFNQEKNGPPVVTEEKVHHDGKSVLSRTKKTDEADPRLLEQTHLEQNSLNRRFRQISDFLRGVQYLHIVPQLVRDPGRSKEIKDDPFGGDFLSQVARTPKTTQRARLARIEKALQVAVPNLVDLKLMRDEATGAPHLQGKFAHWRPQGKMQDEAHFSDGTLRLLGLLWSIQAGTGPLLLEEPELSLHPGVVRHIPALLAKARRIKGRQVVVSSHSTELLRDEGIGLDEVLLLIPTAQDTVIKPATDVTEAQHLLEHGGNLADLVLAYTEPRNSDQLSLVDFGK